MNLARLSFLGLSLPLVALACASPASTDSSAAASQEMTASWFSAHIPAGSALELDVLALVNDRTMTQARFVSECGYLAADADNIIGYRAGDDFLSTSDDQKFDTLAELDAIPFTDETFWTSTIRCAVLHTPGPSVCVPDDHPPVIVELVVDESGSMSGEKWEATRDSILALYTKFSAAGDAKTLVGTLLFDDDVTTRVAPKAVTSEQLEDLDALVDKPSPHGGGTGLEKALTAAYAAVAHAPGASVPGARRIVVVLSDGAPSGGDTEKQASIDLVTQSHADGVELYSVGIGAFPSDSAGTYDPAFMGHLAQAGGTAPAACVADSTDIARVCHVQITPGDDVMTLKGDLTDALDTIRSNMTTSSSCP